MTASNAIVPFPASAELDQEAVAIRDLVVTARSDIVNSVRLLIEAGRRLAAKKAALPHGAWLPWLEANADVLGFTTPRTAQMLIKSAENADTKLLPHLTADVARALSREIWGHAPRRDDQADGPAPVHWRDKVPSTADAMRVMRRMRQRITRNGKPVSLAASMSDKELDEAANHASALKDWLDELETAIEERRRLHEWE
jgi:hypothetical protein